MASGGKARSDHANFLLEELSLVQRILVTTDGTVTHILEAYAGEPVHVVKLSSSLLSHPSERLGFGLGDHERALKRNVLLRGRQSGTTFIYAESVVMLDRVPPPMVEGLLGDDTPIGRLLVASRLETFREIIALSEGPADGIAPHFGIQSSDAVVSRTYRILAAGQLIAWITEKFPKAAFSAEPLATSWDTRRGAKSVSTAAS